MNNDDTFKTVQMAFKSKHYFKCSSFYLICVVSGIYIGAIETVLEKKNQEKLTKFIEKFEL